MDLFATVAEIEVKKPILKKITLQNYRNIAYREILVGEKGLILQGKNGLGKTNIIEGAYRNLSGKLFNGSSKSDTQVITPVGADREAKTSVKLEFDKDNFTFELISYDEYTKKDKTYKGTAYDYYVNEALTKKGQAIEVLYSYLGIKELNDRWAKDDRKNIDLIDLLFNIDYLKTIDYKYLRALVVDIVGDVNFTDVINDNPTKYGKLVAPLQENGLNMETVKAKYRVKKFGKPGTFGLEDLIVSSKNNLKNLEVKASAEYDLNEITLAKQSLQDIESKIVDLRVKKQQGTSELTSAIDLEIGKLERDLMTEQHRIQVEYSKTVASLKDDKVQVEIQDKEKSLNTLRNQRNEIVEKVNREKSLVTENDLNVGKKTNEKQSLLLQRKNLLEKYNQLKTPQSSETITCPHCNQPFSLHESKEHKTIVDSQLAEVTKQGLQIKTRLEELKEGLDTLGVEREVINGRILKLQGELKQVEENIKAVEIAITDLKQRQSQTTLLAPTLDLNGGNVLSIKNNIQTLKTRKETVLNDYQTIIKDIDSQIAVLEAQKQPLKETLNKEIIINNYRKELESERATLQRLETELIDVDDILMLIKDVEQEKYTRIENKVKDTFGDNFKFELFKENVDGSVDTRVCVMLVKDVHGNFVRVENLNTGLYPIRAIEFVERVRNFYNIPKSFIFVDELSALDTEHTKQLMHSGLQIIATRPSDSDKIEEVEIK